MASLKETKWLLNIKHIVSFSEGHLKKNSAKKARASNCLQNALTSRMLKVISKLLEKD